ncbi:MAG: hypothetical protein H6Q76_407 [Firmicutes bacterium]|nr:hypothetical protein [Bacillota bacterium]
MLLKLAAARMENGYPTKKSFIKALNSAGLKVSIHKYNRIERGCQKADICEGIFIARFLNRKPEDIFFAPPDSKTVSV